MKIGVLALQGAVKPHLEKIAALGAEGIRVTNVEDIARCDRMILPGGESTTMLKLIDSNRLWEPLLHFFKTKPTWGTCAGAILLAKKVLHPTQKSFEAIEIAAERNAYGSQLDSFKTSVTISPLEAPLEVDFIRAPKLSPLSDQVEVLSSYDGSAVCLRQKNILVSSFHAELGNSCELHRYFQSF